MLLVFTSHSYHAIKIWKNIILLQYGHCESQDDHFVHACVCSRDFNCNCTTLLRPYRVAGAGGLIEPLWVEGTLAFQVRVIRFKDSHQFRLENFQFFFYTKKKLGNLKLNPRVDDFRWSYQISVSPRRFARDLSQIFRPKLLSYWPGTHMLLSVGAREVSVSCGSKVFFSSELNK